MFCANNNVVRYLFRDINNGNVELEVKFNAQNKLKRWLDLGTYTTFLVSIRALILMFLAFLKRNLES